jgi:predicted nucleic acid-binding protein
VAGRTLVCSVSDLPYVSPLDSEAARHVARLGELVHRQRVALPDLIIGATAVRHGLVLLTRNMSEFGRLGIAARDPFIELPPDA